VKERKVQFKFVRSEDNVADVFTKVLTEEKNKEN